MMISLTSELTIAPKAAPMSLRKTAAESRTILSTSVLRIRRFAHFVSYRESSI